MGGKDKYPQIIQEDDGDTWMGSFADLMSLLLGFFVILYSFSKIDDSKFDSMSSELSSAFNGKVKKENKEESDINERTNRAMQLLVSMLNVGSPEELINLIESQKQEQTDTEKVKKFLSENVGRGFEKISKEDNEIAIKFVFPTKNIFQRNSYALTSNAFRRINKITKEIEEINDLIHVEIRAYSNGVRVKNQRNPYIVTSTQAGIISEQIRKSGISPSKILVRGMGTHGKRPFTSRVEIHVLRKKRS